MPPVWQPPQAAAADLWQCDDCGTNFHLEWVGASVQVRQPTAALPSPSAQWSSLPFKVLVLVVLVMAVLVGVSFLLAPVGSK